GVGAALVAFGLGWMGVWVHDQSYPVLLPGYIALGVGIGLVMTPANTDAMNATPVAMRGESSGVIQTIRQQGGSLELAVMGTDVANVQSSKIVGFIEQDAGATHEQAEQIARVLSESEQTQQAATQQVSPGVLEAAADALTSAVAASYWVACGAMAVAS